MTARWPQAILLDLDDTILAFDSVADASWMTVCERHADQFGAASVHDVIASIKLMARQFWQDPERHRTGRLNLLSARMTIIGDSLHRLGIVDDSLISQIAVEYDIARTEAIHPIRGAIETIEEMRTAGVKLALITNGASISQQAKIKRFHLVNLFDCIFVEEECGYGKPDERAYLQALSILDTSPADAWMVGDNWEWEVVAPQKLGIRGIWVNRDDDPIPANSGTQPYRTVRFLSELRHGVRE